MRGVGRGDRVALILENSVEFVVMMFATARLGAVSVPLNTRHQEAENRYILLDCTPKLIVYEAALADRVPAPGVVPGLMHHVAVHRDQDTPLATLLGNRRVAQATRVLDEEIATILYTSGTTGRPKGAMLTHMGRVHSAMHYAMVMSLTEDDRATCTVPMSHVTGISAMIDSMIYCAGTLIIMKAFRASEFIDLATRHGMTFTVIVPAMFNLCLLAPSFEAADLSAWRISGYGGAIMPEVTLGRIAEMLPHLELVNAYGSTETTSPAVLMPPDQAVSRKEYVGLTLPCAHIVVMDEDGREVAPNTLGEVYIGGATVVPGYWGDPEATGREFKGGYWKSGDLGAMDEEGYLRVVDRIKDVINRGGYKVYASEVENALLDHPAVIEAAVVAKPCPVLGERVHAFINLADAVASDDELTAHCASLLSDYKVPEAFHRIDAGLPRNAAGKVLKRQLRNALV